MKRSSHLQSFLVLILAVMGCGGSEPPASPPPAIAECLVYYGDLVRTWLPTEFPVEVVIDSKVANDQVALILDAIDLWNEKLDTEVMFATVTEDTYPMHGDCNFVTVATKPLLPDPDVGLTTYGPCASDHIDVLTSPQFSIQQIRNIAAHELGHVLGVPHDETDMTSVMYPQLQSHATLISERSSCLVQIAMRAAEGR